jgi:hypothetical protein
LLPSSMMPVLAEAHTHLELSTELSTVSAVLLTPITHSPAVKRVADDSSADAEPLPTRRK